jgi:hypothetical protein
VTDRSDVRAAILSAADDWHAEPASWEAGTDPLRMLLTMREHGEIDVINSGLVYMAVGYYVTGATDRQQLETDLLKLIPDDSLRQE